MIHNQQIKEEISLNDLMPVVYHKYHCGIQFINRNRKHVMMTGNNAVNISTES